MGETGRIIIVTGDGKGKTTTAIGMALQAVGLGKRVFMAQFMKAPDTSGEHFAATALEPNLVIKPLGRKGFIHRRGGELEDREMAQKALDEARSHMLVEGYDVIVLDEVNVAIGFGLLEPGDLVDFITSKPATTDLIITGRNAHPDVVRLADSILEMEMVKHHFNAGVPAQKGIEY